MIEIQATGRTRTDSNSGERAPVFMASTRLHGDETVILPDGTHAYVVDYPGSSHFALQRRLQRCAHGNDVAIEERIAPADVPPARRARGGIETSWHGAELVGWIR